MSNVVGRMAIRIRKLFKGTSTETKGGIAGAGIGVVAAPSLGGIGIAGFGTAIGIWAIFLWPVLFAIACYYLVKFWVRKNARR